MDALLSTTCSYFMDKKALFGSFPTQGQVKVLEREGVRYFVDLTNHNERGIVPYTTTYAYTNYPIDDHGIPKDISRWCSFILNIKYIIEALQYPYKVYIHCKGGHGRCGLVVATLLCLMEGLDPDVSIAKTTFYHNKRSMKAKWKRLGSPQTKKQVQFISDLFEPYQTTHRQAYTEPNQYCTR